MSDGIAKIHLIVDGSEHTMSVGDAQIAWLLEADLVEYVASQPTSDNSEVRSYMPRDPDLTVEVLNERLMLEPSIRECDFCFAMPAGWLLNARPFMTPWHGRFTRKVVICDECEPLVRETDKPALVDRAINAAAERAVNGGGPMAAHVAGLTPAQIRAGLEPMVKGFAVAVFGARDGYPYRDEEVA